MIKVNLNIEFPKKSLFCMWDNLLCTVQSVFCSVDVETGNTSFAFIKDVLLKYVTITATPVIYLLHLVSLLYFTAD